MSKLPFNRLVYYKDQTIFSQGDPGDRMYYVEHGRVRIWRRAGERFVTLAEITDGGIFGEMVLIDDQPRSASATAMEDSTLQIIPGDIVKEKLAKTDPFMRKLITILSRNLRRSDEFVAEQHSEDPPAS